MSARFVREKSMITNCGCYSRSHKKVIITIRSRCLRILASSSVLSIMLKTVVNNNALCGWLLRAPQAADPPFGTLVSVFGRYIMNRIDYNFARKNIIVILRFEQVGNRVGMAYYAEQIGSVAAQRRV